MFNQEPDDKESGNVFQSERDLGYKCRTTSKDENCARSSCSYANILSTFSKVCMYGGPQHADFSYIDHIHPPVRCFKENTIFHIPHQSHIRCYQIWALTVLLFSLRSHHSATVQSQKASPSLLLVSLFQSVTTFRGWFTYNSQIYPSLNLCYFTTCVSFFSTILFHSLSSTMAAPHSRVPSLHSWNFALPNCLSSCTCCFHSCLFSINSLNF
jgi:hypothetical protein